MKHTEWYYTGTRWILFEWEEDFTDSKSLGWVRFVAVMKYKNAN